MCFVREAPRCRAHLCFRQDGPECEMSPGLGIRQMWPGVLNPSLKNSETLASYLPLWASEPSDFNQWLMILLKAMASVGTPLVLTPFSFFLRITGLCSILICSSIWIESLHSGSHLFGWNLGKRLDLIHRSRGHTSLQF